MTRISHEDISSISRKVFSEMAHAVRGIMVESQPNFYIADNSIKFGRDVRFGILIKKEFGRDVRFGILIKSIYDMF